MRLLGLQRLTLLDFPGKIACTVFTGGCNLRCPFCHNSSLVHSLGEEIEEEEFFAFLDSRKSRLEGVCVSGGEPTIYRDLIPFLYRIKELGYLVKLDTNGYRPAALKEAVTSGLVDYVAMDIKNSKESYARTVGLENFDIKPILESTEFLMSGAVDFEFRTTLVRELHTERDIYSIGTWLEGEEKYFLQTFEDSGDLLSSRLSGYDKNETKDLLNLIKVYIKNAQIRG